MALCFIALHNYCGSKVLTWNNLSVIVPALPSVFFDKIFWFKMNLCNLTTILKCELLCKCGTINILHVVASGECKCTVCEFPAPNVKAETASLECVLSLIPVLLTGGANRETVPGAVRPWLQVLCDPEQQWRGVRPLPSPHCLLGVWMHWVQ